MVTTLRALVMLSVLVGLPAAWVYYGPLPPGAQRMVNQCVAAAKDAVEWDKIDWSRLPKFDLPWSKTPPAATAPVALATAPRFDGKPATAPPVASPLAQNAITTPGTSPTSPIGGSSPTMSAAALSGPTPLHDQLEPLLAQLRALNVAQYALERWGDGGEMFRFRCSMPVTTGVELTQEFQATADSPRAAVEQVVTEVTAWDSARMAQDAPRRLASN